MYWEILVFPHVTFQNSLDLDHYEEQTSSLTKHYFDKWYFKIFFLSKDKYFSAEVTIYLLDWVFLIWEKTVIQHDRL